MTMPSSLPVLNEFLELVLPGNSEAIRRVRAEVIEFGMNPLARTLLIEGPIGAGKSTLARVIGMVKRVAPLTESEARMHVDLTRFDEAGRVDQRLMPWYVELTLTGLTESLADVQLFGAIKGAYTDALPRAGIFELAQTGRRPRGPEEPGALLTGGVVFLDEIGDLSLANQAKLLPVLSGGVFYRVGAEGNREYEFNYTGTTIAASWHALEHEVRKDLYSRLSANRIRLPSVDDRAADFNLIVDGLQKIIQDSARTEIARMIQVDQANLDRAYYQSLGDSIELLNEHSRKVLANANWGALGNLRGLTTAIQKILIAKKSPEEAISSLAEFTVPDDYASNALTLIDRLLDRKPNGQGLVGHIHEIELEDRKELRELLKSDRNTRKQLADALGLNENTLSQHIAQMDRRRVRRTKQDETK